MRIIIHAGANKAGSTSVQHWFSAHRDELLQQGVLWPKTGLLHNAHYGLSQSVGFGPAELAADAVGFDRLRRSFRQEVENSKAEVVIISSETFMLDRSLELLRSFLEGYRVEVVFALRRHDYWWPSLWSEAIRIVEDPPWGSRFESFHDFQLRTNQQHFNYQRLVQAWEAYFPDNVRAFAFEPQQLKDGIVSRFLSVAGLGGLVLRGSFREMAINISPSVDVLALIDTIQRDKVIEKEHKAKLVGWALELQGTAKKPADFLSGRTRCQLIAPHLADYAYLGERFGGGDGLFFRDPEPVDDGIDGPHELPAKEALSLLIRECARMPALLNYFTR